MANKTSEKAAPARVAAAERTLTILDAFSRLPAPASLGELEVETGLFRSVLFRYLLSFEELGFVTKTMEGKYSLTGKVLQLAASFEASFNLEDLLRPALKGLSEETHESAVFYVPMQGKRLCLSRVDSSQTVRVSINPGDVREYDETATGLVFRRYCENRPKQSLVSELPIRTSGVGDSMSASISAPVFRAGEHFVGALTISGPTSRFSPDHPATVQHSSALHVISA